MNSATLPFRPHLREPQQVMPAVAEPPPVAAQGTAARQDGRRYRGVQLSALLHGLAVLLLWNVSGGGSGPALATHAVELIRVAPPRPLQPSPKPPQPQARPVALAAPRPVSAATPQPKTVAAPATSAETYASPAMPAPAMPIGPVTPLAPVPTPSAPVAVKAPPPAARVVGTDGIPTDYVNQVYARINRNTDYPGQARLRRQQGKVGYQLTLDPQGNLLDIDLQGCGIEALDDAARQAIMRAAPFPKLPDLGGSTYLLAGNIVFKLN
ncbi:TonB family protein [Janthinobacterium agaricidamnosum]|uniref:TonB family C-terminal domain protein n=1 Tax=Janthinobacterium agaricidamnosum NBRC 102515 = DSM 9628 TaxID=1349767 RepID=W0V3A8_9BURK|nr:TonB family protein [Janthinobacterium agaricidamnosum]CDG82356.1 tonB family C-terminal domain protein [Janthinobacterium agaricidamnosum NBRC 102515 = DSM 9628]